MESASALPDNSAEKSLGDEVELIAHQSAMLAYQQACDRQCVLSCSCFPYGTGFTNVCNTPTDNASLPQPTSAVETASHPQCTGGVAGLFDMSGNVREWVSDCDSVGRYTVGGSYKYTVGGSYKSQLVPGNLGRTGSFLANARQAEYVLPGHSHNSAIMFAFAAASRLI